MSDTIGKASFELTADIGKFRSNLLSAEGLAHAASTAIGTAMGSLVNTAMQKLQQLSAIPGKALALYNTQFGAIAQVEARIRSTAGAAGLSSIELQKMAASLQRVTDFGDETTLQLQSLLLTFPQIKGDVFRQATEAVQDMATAMAAANGGMVDGKSAAIQLGKALSDPIKGAASLREVGVALSDQQANEIKRFMDMNQIAKAQGVILKELSTEFSGSARAARDAGDGSASLMNSWNDLMETMGSSIKNIVKPLNTELRGIVETVDKMIKASDNTGQTFEEMVRRMNTARTYQDYFNLKKVVTEMGEEAKIVSDIIGGIPISLDAMRNAGGDVKSRLFETVGWDNGSGIMIRNLSLSAKQRQANLDSWIQSVVHAGLLTEEMVIKADASYARLFSKPAKQKASDFLPNDPTADAAVWAAVDKQAADDMIKSNADKSKSLNEWINVVKDAQQAQKDLRDEAFNAVRAQGKSWDEMKRDAEEWAKNNPLPAEIVKTSDIINNAGVSALNNFADAINNAVWASQGFKEIAKNFGIAIGQMATELAAKAGIFYLLNLILPGSGFVAALGASWGFLTKSEHGNAFNDGQLLAFAHGGVVDRPTVFPMRNGMGLMGEDGAEAVMPLKRNSRGDLGVTATMSPIHTHVYLNGREIATAVHSSDRLDKRRGL